MTTPERRPCGTCGKSSSVNADGTIRHHSTTNPEFRAGPDSNRCKGAGQPPAGETPEQPAGEDDLLGHVCRNCHRPVQLTDNGRARSHLDPHGDRCGGGSDWPLRVDRKGNRTDTAPADMAPWGVGAEDTARPTMADQLRAAGDEPCPHPESGRDQYGDEACIVCGKVLSAPASQPSGSDDVTSIPQASRFAELLAAEASGAGTVLGAYPNADRHAVADAAASMDRTASAVLSLPPDPALNHRYTDPSGVEWTHGGPAEACELPDCHAPRTGREYCEQCDTDNHRCPGCGADVPHGTVACEDCDRRVQANRLPVGETDDGRPCHHDDAVFGVEDGKAVCIACGTPCTHPDGFKGTADDVDEDGQDRVVSTCELCGAMDPEDELSDDGNPDPELPNCPHPETHRAGCGCPEDGECAHEQYKNFGPKAGVRCAACNAKHPDPHAYEADVAIATVEAERAAEDREYHQTIIEELDRQQAREDAWRTPADLVARMPQFARDLDAQRLDCLACGHPVTPLVDRFNLYGDPETIAWSCREEFLSGHRACRDHECAPNTRVRLGDLDEGDHFIRRGALMRLTERESATSVLAVVIGGPHDGRTGELKNLDETVERAPEPQTKETEQTCADDRTRTRQRPSSAAPATTTAPAPGSPPATGVSAPAAGPRSTSATASAPTARAAGRDRSAVVTTDQSDAAARFLGGSRPTAPTQPTGPANQADAAAQFLAGGSGSHGEKETKRDRFGRYLIPHPDTGKEQAWTRATTFAKSISDTFALSQWGLRMALLGATQRPDIVARAHGKHVRVDKQLLDELTAELKNVAGDKVAANHGTNVHSFTEMADRAWHSPGGPRSIMNQVPPDYREMVETYIRLLEETGLEPVPHLIEFTTVVKQYGVAGTSDNCYRVTKPLTLRVGRGEVRFQPGEYTIGDKKTGRDLDYGWQEIAIQLGTYAQGLNTSGVWDRQDEVWEPDPLSRFDKPGTKVRTDAGIVIHLPLDKESTKQPAVYGIDLESGWNAAVLCERVRAWRKMRNLASPVMVSETAEVFAPARPEAAVTTRTTVHPPSLMDRAKAVRVKSDASAVWQDATKQGRPEAEVAELVAVMQARLRELAEPGG